MIGEGRRRAQHDRHKGGILFRRRHDTVAIAVERRAREPHRLAGALDDVVRLTGNKAGDRPLGGIGVAINDGLAGGEAVLDGESDGVCRDARGRREGEGDGRAGKRVGLRTGQTHCRGVDANAVVGGVGHEPAELRAGAVLVENGVAGLAAVRRGERELVAADATDRGPVIEPEADQVADERRAHRRPDSGCPTAADADRSGNHLGTDHRLRDFDQAVNGREVVDLVGSIDHLPGGGVGYVPRDIVLRGGIEGDDLDVTGGKGIVASERRAELRVDRRDRGGPLGAHRGEIVAGRERLLLVHPGVGRQLGGRERAGEREQRDAGREGGNGDVAGAGELACSDVGVGLREDDVRGVGPGPRHADAATSSEAGRHARGRRLGADARLFGGRERDVAAGRVRGRDAGVGVDHVGLDVVADRVSSQPDADGDGNRTTAADGGSERGGGRRDVDRRGVEGGQADRGGPHAADPVAVDEGLDIHADGVDRTGTGAPEARAAAPGRCHGGGSCQDKGIDRLRRGGRGGEGPGCRDGRIGEIGLRRAGDGVGGQ